MTPPPDYEEGAGRTAIRIWEKSVGEHVRRMSQLTENIKTLYSLVWGQCSDVVRQKAESHDSFLATSTVGDGLALLSILKGISFHFQSQKYVGHSIHEVLKRYYNCSQGRFATTQAYMEHFQNIVDVVIHNGGSISGHPGLKKMITNPFVHVRGRGSRCRVRDTRSLHRHRIPPRMRQGSSRQAH